MLHGWRGADLEEVELDTSVADGCVAQVITMSQCESSSNDDAFDRDSDHVRSWIFLFVCIRKMLFAE